MKYLKYFKESKEEIHSICKKYDIKNYTINEDGSIDVGGNVSFHNKGLTELPLKFRKVSGYFDCAYNKLTSLEGAPREVGGYFVCYDNKLKSLSGAPEKVVGGFNCHNNQLKSLEGFPREVGGHFSCSGNQLLSLEGISKYISGRINCRYNKLRDVRGVNENWRGEFLVEDNPVYEIFKFFTKERWDEVIEFLNEYNVIRDGKVIILQALEQVYWEMGLEVPEIEEIEGYEIQY
jgi:hypothetical protein